MPQVLSLSPSLPVVVAEVTQPSLGVGYELGRAVVLNKQILCLFRPRSGRGEHPCPRWAPLPLWLSVDPPVSSLVALSTALSLVNWGWELRSLEDSFAFTPSQHFQP